MWDYQFAAKFYGESNGDSHEALKRCLDPEMGHKSLVYGQKSINFGQEKVRPPFSRKKLTENRLKIALKPKNDDWTPKWILIA